MQVELITTDNILKYVTEGDGWTSDMLLLLAGALAVLFVALVLCRKAISKGDGRFGATSSRLANLYERIGWWQIISAAGALTMLAFAFGAALAPSIQARIAMQDDVLSKIEQAYNIDFSARDEDDILDALHREPGKIKDANGDRKDPSVEPLALEESWVETERGLAPKQYYFMVTDYTDDTATFNLIEQGENGDWVKIAPSGDVSTQE